MSNSDYLAVPSPNGFREQIQKGRNDTMRKADIIGVGLAVFILILSISVFLYALGNNIGAAQPKTDEPVSYSYLIKEYNGNIAVFKTGEDTPDQIYEVPVETLPAADIQNLQSGIQVYNEQQLQTLIEDLTS